jgi:hypothetical protein
MAGDSGAEGGEKEAAGGKRSSGAEGGEKSAHGAATEASQDDLLDGTRRPPLMHACSVHVCFGPLQLSGGDCEDAKSACYTPHKSRVKQ